MTSDELRAFLSALSDSELGAARVIAETLLTARRQAPRTKVVPLFPRDDVAAPEEGGAR